MRIKAGRNKQIFSLILIAACLGMVATNSCALAEAQQATDPPIPVLPLPPPFHFSNPTIDRDYNRLYGQVLEKSELAGQSLEAARAALGSARGAPIGSAAWLQARDSIGQAIRDRRPHREALRALLHFLHDVRGRVSSAESPIVDEFQRQAQEEITASSDRLLDLLALLAGLRIGQWPP